MWGWGRIAGDGEEECGAGGESLAALAPKTSQRKHNTNEPDDSEMVWMGRRDTSWAGGRNFGGTQTSLVCSYTIGIF
jgi:hypothetical protein